MLMLPSRDPALRSRRAFWLERTGGTRRRPVSPQPLPVLLVCIAIREALTSWTTIDVVIVHIDEVLFAEPPFRLGPRGHRLRQCDCDPGLVAGQYLWAVK